MTGITRAAAAQVIAGHFGTSAIHVGGSYDTYTVRDNDNRQWKVVSDASIRRESRRGESRNSAYAVEFVSPICKYEDIETIQELIRKLRSAGAKVNASCGIHVHIDASPHDVKTLRNIVNIMAAKEDLLYKTLKVNVNREHYCAKADIRFLDELNAKRPTSMDRKEVKSCLRQRERKSSYYGRIQVRWSSLKTTIAKTRVKASRNLLIGQSAITLVTSQRMRILRTCPMRSSLT